MSVWGISRTLSHNVESHVLENAIVTGNLHFFVVRHMCFVIQLLSEKVKLQKWPRIAYVLIVAGKHAICALSTAAARTQARSVTIINRKPPQTLINQFECSNFRTANVLPFVGNVRRSRIFMFNQKLSYLRSNCVEDLDSEQYYQLLPPE